MGRPRSRTPVPGKSRRRRDTGPRADPESKENDTQQFDPYGAYDSRIIQQSLTHANIPVVKTTIVRTQTRAIERLPSKRETILPRGQNAGYPVGRTHNDDENAEQSAANPNRRRRGSSLGSRRNRRDETNDGRPKVSGLTGYVIDRPSSYHQLGRQRSLDTFDYEIDYATQGNGQHVNQSESTLGRGRRSNSNDTHARRQSEGRARRSESQYAVRSLSNIGRRRRPTSPDNTQARRTSRDRGRRPESTQPGHDSDRRESRRRSSSSRLRGDRKRKQETRNFSDKKLSKEYATMFFSEDEPRIEIRNEEITRGRYGVQRAIYFLFKVTALDAEKIKDNLEVRFLFRNDSGQESIKVFKVSPKSIRTSVNPVDRTNDHGWELGMDLGMDKFGGNSKGYRGKTKAWTEPDFWELKGQGTTYEVTASLKRHGDAAPLIPLPFDLQFVISDCGPRPFYIACDVDWTRKGSLVSDDGWSGFWREVDMTARVRETCSFGEWTQEDWESKGELVGFAKE